MYLKAGTNLRAPLRTRLETTIAVNDPAMGVGPEDAASLSITIVDTNRPPSVEDAVVQTDEDTVIVAPLTLQDADGDTLTVTLLDTPTWLGNWLVVSDALGTRIHYDPSQSLGLQALGTGESTDEAISFQVHDGQGGTVNGVLHVTVRGRNDWHHPSEPLSVNQDALIEPLDGPSIVNSLNMEGARTLPGVMGKPPFYFDTSDDNSITSLDALLVINFLNRGSGKGR